MRDYHRLSLQRARTFEAHAAAVTATEQNASSHADRAQNGVDIRNTMEDTQENRSTTMRNRTGSASSGANRLQDLDYAAEQPLKDPKSFTQNLFDTLSLRMVEWLPLRRTNETFRPSTKQPASHSDNERSSHEKRQQKPNMEANKSKPTTTHEPSPLPHVHGPHPRTPSSRTSGTHPSAVEVKFPNQQVKRLSITEVESWRQSSRSGLEDKKRPDYQSRKPSMTSHLTSNDFTSMPSPPALKHRPQKHCGRVGDLENAQPKERSKNQRRVSWHSEKIMSQPPPTEEPAKPQLRPRPCTIDAESPSERKSKHGLSRHPPEPAPLALTVTHLTPEIIDGLGKMINQTPEDEEAWREELDLLQMNGGFDSPEWRFATPQQRQVFPFVAQSVFFVLSSARHILRSFRTNANEPKSVMMENRLDVSTLRDSLRHLFTVCPWDIALHSVWVALEKLFVPPDELPSSARPSRRSSRSSTMVGGNPATPMTRRMSESTTDEPLSDADAAYIATVALFVLVSSVPNLDSRTWRGIRRMRAMGGVAPSADMDKLPSEQVQQAVETTDQLEHELGLRLVNRLVRALTARLAYHEISKTCQVYSLDFPKQSKTNILDRIMDHLSEHHDLKHSHFPGPSSLIVEWLRTLFLREWDGNPEMARSSGAGGAVQIMALMYRERDRLGLSPEEFETPLLSERLDLLEMPPAWAATLPNNRTLHLLSYPFLFPPSYLVTYFRSLNHSAMAKYYEAAMTTTRHVTQTAFGNISITDDAALLARMKVSMSAFLVLVVRRDDVLTDAMNQLWRRQKRELLRPLKVQMGMDEGEEGLDHGGVQQEFFRVAMADALDPSYGMFTMDPRHRISWFLPCSWEPAYKFELLGLLMSIAVYNGVTLPINFPIAFYRKLLGLKVKHLDHIRDGWPELTQGLESLLEWKDGDVGDIFMRTYEFSFESFGHVETVDMQKVDRDAPWPLPAKGPSPGTAKETMLRHDVPQCSDPAAPSPPPSMAASAADLSSNSVPRSLRLQSPTPPCDEAALVTNYNRKKFVKDYIFWLTDKSIRPQFEAFARGFQTCIDRSALSIFTPEALKAVVEGSQEINIKELENHARYEGGFGPNHRVVRDFWSIVQQYSAEKKAQLLEFITASDRIPVNGVSSIMFVIQKNGVGDLVSANPFFILCVHMLIASFLAPADQLDLFRSPVTTGIFVQGSSGCKAGQGIRKRSGVWRCIAVLLIWKSVPNIPISFLFDVVSLCGLVSNEEYCPYDLYTARGIRSARVGLRLEANQRFPYGSCGDHQTECRSPTRNNDLSKISAHLSDLQPSHPQTFHALFSP